MGRVSGGWILFSGATYRAGKRVALRIRCAIRSKQSWHPIAALYHVYHVAILSLYSACARGLGTSKDLGAARRASKRGGYRSPDIGPVGAARRDRAWIGYRAADIIPGGALCRIAGSVQDPVNDSVEASMASDSLALSYLSCRFCSYHIRFRMQARRAEV